MAVHCFDTVDVPQSGRPRVQVTIGRGNQVVGESQSHFMWVDEDDLKVDPKVRAAHEKSRAATIHAQRHKVV